MPVHPADSYRPLVLQRCGGCGEQSRPSAPEFALSRHLRLSTIEADAVILILLYDRGRKENASVGLAQFRSEPTACANTRLAHQFGRLVVHQGRSVSPHGMRCYYQRQMYESNGEETPTDHFVCITW